MAFTMNGINELIKKIIKKLKVTSFLNWRKANVASFIKCFFVKFDGGGFPMHTVPSKI